MSNMLEQAIADAAALREQAIKNAEQSVIEKYSHQIKEAVDAMLENKDLDEANDMIAEAEGEMGAASCNASIFGGGQEGATIEAPPAWDSRYDDIGVKFNALVDSLPRLKMEWLTLTSESLKCLQRKKKQWVDQTMTH